MTIFCVDSRVNSNSTWPWLFLVLAVWLMLLGGRPAHAAGEASGSAAQQVEQQQKQPLNNAPVWREVRSGEVHTTNARGPEAGVLIQTEGMTWRALRNGPVTLYGGVLLLVVVASILLFYKAKGPLKLHDAPTGRLVERFNRLERIVHWGTAISFMLLAITGLAILFGKHVIVPVLGHTLFGYLMIVGKNVHNFIGPVFLGFTLVMIVIWARDNVWQACDALWISKAGGLVNGEHVPSGRFNFGEKTWFWFGVTILGLVVAGSGLVMDFPNFGQLRETMQTFNLIHVITAILLMLLSFGHIYMGTIGVNGALDSMKTGQVDETWAREHHEHWYNDVKAGKSGHPSR
jgi:formate dehydrogenase subunit gamma